MAAVPLTKARPGSERVVNRDKRPLQGGVKTFKGGLAAVNSAGYFGPATGAAGEIVVGLFYEGVDNSLGANGALLADIRYPYERALRLVDNDTTAPVVIASRERVCSVLDDHTATLAAAGASTLGVVYDVTSEGVWVDMTSGGNPLAANGLGVQSGTTTLIAGTKTVTGVTLTATSRILLTMKDPGAGALTTFIALDAPVAGRTASTSGANGQFIINAIDNAKATLATAVCTVDYLIIG